MAIGAWFGAVCTGPHRSKGNLEYADAGAGSQEHRASTFRSEWRAAVGLGKRVVLGHNVWCIDLAGGVDVQQQRQWSPAGPSAAGAYCRLSNRLPASLAKTHSRPSLPPSYLEM